MYFFNKRVYVGLHCKHFDLKKKIANIYYYYNLYVFKFIERTDS